MTDFNENQVFDVQVTEPVKPDRDDSGSASTIVYFFVVAAVFFAIGFGTAWFAINTSLDNQVAELETMVESAVASAFGGAIDGLAAAPSEPEAPQIYDVSVDDDPFIGPEDAPVTIVEFSDFRCGYCGRFYNETFKPLLEQYEGQVRFVYRDFPVVGGERAAQLAQCVFAQSDDMFWQYHDIVFADQSVLQNDDTLLAAASEIEGIDADALATCLAENTYAAEVQADFEDGLSYGVRGTPAFYINGKQLVGAQPIGAFQALIDEALAEVEAG